MVGPQINMDNLVDRMKEALGKVQVLNFRGCVLNEKFPEIIEMSPNLRSLIIDGCKIEYNWLNRNYQTLEYFEFIPCGWKSEFTVEIPIFLQLNPNIRKFSTNFDCFCEIRDSLMNAIDIKLDDFFLNINSHYAHSLASICCLLNELYERKFYKRLRLYYGGCNGFADSETMKQFGTITGLVRLWPDFYADAGIPIYGLEHIEEFGLEYSNKTIGLNLMPNKFINLKYIDFLHARIDDIEPFIVESVRLTTIRITELIDDNPYTEEWMRQWHDNDDTFGYGIFDLKGLNDLREKLPEAQKITLFVGEESVYLATKSAMKGTDFNLIRIKRDFSHGSNDDI